MLILTLERSYVSLCVFLCQVKFMKKGISKETLADLCYCDTSSIYLVTSWRKDPYCAEKIPVTIVCQDFKGSWEVSWHCSGVARWPWQMLPVTDPCSCGNSILGEAHLCSADHRPDTTDPGLGQVCLCSPLCAASNRGGCWPQNLVVVVQWGCRRAAAEFLFMNCLGYMTLFSPLELLWG